MTQVRCKNHCLLDSQRICCYDNESVTIEHHFDDASILKIIFNFNYDDKGRRYSISSAGDDGIIFDLYNFNSHIPCGLKKAQPLAAYDGHEVSIVFYVTLIPGGNPILDYSLYLEV